MAGGGEGGGEEKQEQGRTPFGSDNDLLFELECWPSENNCSLFSFIFGTFTKVITIQHLTNFDDFDDQGDYQTFLLCFFSSYLQI